MTDESKREYMTALQSINRLQIQSVYVDAGRITAIAHGPGARAQLVRRPA